MPDEDDRFFTIVFPANGEPVDVNGVDDKINLKPDLRSQNARFEILKRAPQFKVGGCLAGVVNAIAVNPRLTIKALIEDGLLDATGKNYLITPPGEEELAAYTIRKKQAKVHAERKSFELILEGKYSAAYTATAQYRSDYEWWGGIGVDWKNESRQGLPVDMRRAITMYVKGKPTISGALKLFQKQIQAFVIYKEIDPNLKNAAIKRLCPEGANVEGFYAAIHAGRAYVYSYKTVEMLKRVGTKQYQILACLDDETCEKCGLMDRRVFDLKDVQPGINCPPFCDCCRCVITPYVEKLPDKG